jgi:GT2 family glycosyltransferase
MRTRDKIAIGWLDPGQVDGMFALSVANVYASRSDRIAALIRVEAGGLLSRGRNELVARFMETTEFEWLLMLDSDEQISVEAFDKLVASVHDKDKPIVAGLYFGAWPGDYYPTAMPLIFKRLPDSTRFMPFVDYPTDSLVEIDSAGTGCLLIHRSVFEAFQAEATPHEGKSWCWFRDMPVNGDWFSEDHFFCARAKELGFPIWAHTGATLPHRKQFWLAERHHRPTETTRAVPPMETRRGVT